MTEIVNVEQAAAWDGPQGEIWVAREEAQNIALAAHSAHLHRAAAVRPADRVLDVGCGTGDTTRACARIAVDGDALGVDLSTAMLERARARAVAEGLTNVRFEHGDAQVHPFPPTHFDLVISRFGVMFFAEPVAAFTNLVHTTAPGGRLAAVAWQGLDRNEWVSVPREVLLMGRVVEHIVDDVPGAFGLADPGRVHDILTAAGYAEIQLDDVAVPFRFGDDADAATEYALAIGLIRGLLDGLDADDQVRAIEAIHTAMEARASSEGVVFDSRIWVITAVR